MNKISKIILLTFIGINIIFCASYVIFGEIHFTTDVARDFLLFQEIDQKKILLIGPRSSVSGFYHGPLWLYLNYPAYLIGQGNPIVVGWYWIFLLCISLGISFYVAKKLFNESVAYFYVLFLSLYLIADAKQFLNPAGAFFCMPLFFYFFIRYIRTLNIKYLLLHVLILGFIIQFQMAVGIPLAGLSFLYILIVAIKKKKIKHILSYSLLILLLSNFILFNIKHDYILLKAVFETAGNQGASYQELLRDRVSLFINLPILRESNIWEKIIMAALFWSMIGYQIAKSKQKQIYLLFLYFFVGDVLFSFSNKYYILIHQFITPITPLIFLVFISFMTSKYVKYVTVFLIGLYALNFVYACLYIQAFHAVIGKDRESWKFLSTMTKELYQSEKSDFGYFVYSPDALSYQSQYAMKYEQKYARSHVSHFQKKHITYVISAPPPLNNPYMQDKWWIENKLKIRKKPVTTKKYPNGYKVEKFILTDEETKLPFDQTLDVGLHFR